MHLTDENLHLHSEVPAEGRGGHIGDGLHRNRWHGKMQNVKQQSRQNTKDDRILGHIDTGSADLGFLSMPI